MDGDRLGGTRRARLTDDRGRAMLLAAAVLAAVALAVASIVLARALRGGPGSEALVGTPRADRIAGDGGNDLIRGLGGADRLRGGRGRDILVGGPGPDRLIGGRGRDGFNMRRGVQLDGAGRDVIRARDRRLDEINCGAGRDVAYVDRAEDGVYDCERVIPPR